MTTTGSTKSDANATSHISLITLTMANDLSAGSIGKRWQQYLKNTTDTRHKHQY